MKKYSGVGSTLVENKTEIIGGLKKRTDILCESMCKAGGKNT